MIGSYESNIRKMYLIRFLYNLYFISAVLVPFYTDWGGLKFSRILFLNAWFMGWNFLLEIPTGTVADFLGRKVSMMMGCLIGAVGCVVYVSYPSFALFLFAEIIFSISYTLLSGADEALAYDTLKELNRTEESKTVFSRMESFKLGGMLFAASLGGVIAKTLGLRWPLLLQGIPLLIACFVCWTLREPVISEKKSINSLRSYVELLMGGVRFFKESKVLKLLTWDMVFVNACAWLIIWFYQALLKRVGIDIVYYGFVHSGMTLVEIFIIGRFGFLEKILGGRKRLMLFSSIVPGIFFIILGLVRNPYWTVVGILLIAGFGLTRRPLFSSVMNEYIPSEKRATILSTTSMFSTFAIVISNSIAGYLSDWSIPNTMLLVGIGLLVFSVVSKVFFQESK